MKNRAIIFASAINGLIGAIVGGYLLGVAPSAHAAISTSGYYVCGNKINCTLRMTNTANSCKSSEYKYYILGEATDLG